VKQLIATACNLNAAIVGGEALPQVEVVLVTTEPHYTADAAGTLIRRGETESYRFLASPSGLRKLARDLVEWADDVEEAVAAMLPKPPTEEGRAA
jgi:hypothetical protein